MARERQPDSVITGLPFDDVRAVLSHFPEPDGEAAAAARAACASMGELGPLAAWLAGWKGVEITLNRIQIAIYISMVNAGTVTVDDGLLHQTQDLLAEIAGGGRPVSQLALVHGAGLKVYDLALGLPTGDIAKEPAMDERECAGAMAFGMEGIAGGPDLVAVERAGEGGDIAAAAILSLCYPDLTGALLDRLDGRKRALAEQAAETHGGAVNDPFELLRRLGSRDMAAITGAVMAARTERVPVLLAGLECLAIAALLERAGSGNTAHCLAAHRGSGAEADIVERLGLTVVNAGDLGAEPGVAAGAAIGTLKSAVAAAGSCLRHFQEVDTE